MISESRLLDIVAESLGVLPEEVAMGIDLEPQEDNELLDSLVEWLG